MTIWNNRTSPTTTWTGRTTIIKSDSIPPIITGFWNDLNTWTETGKYWNDAGDGAGTTWNGRTIPA